MAKDTQKRWVAFEVEGDRGQAALAFAFSDSPLNAGEVEMSPHAWYRPCNIEEVESGERDGLPVLTCGEDQGFYPALSKFERLIKQRQ